MGYSWLWTKENQVGEGGREWLREFIVCFDGNLRVRDAVFLIRYYFVLALLGNIFWDTAGFRVY